jgi:hypothetical protein
MGAWSGQEKRPSHSTPIKRLVSEFPSIDAVFLTKYSNDILHSSRAINFSSDT